MTIGPGPDLSSLELVPDSIGKPSRIVEIDCEIIDKLRLTGSNSAALNAGPF
jgi:hypothetical protein